MFDPNLVQNDFIFEYGGSMLFLACVMCTCVLCSCTSYVFAS